MRVKPQIAVVAIGGNALSDGRSTMEDQMRRAEGTARLVRILVERGFNVVVVHGNGPQVGIAWLRQLSAQKENIPPLNLAMCDALTQAEIGTVLELAVINSLNATVPDAEVVTIVSQVEVKPDDPAFCNPTKPIGPFYSPDEAAAVRQQFPEWTLVEDAGRGYRRVVPSPVPVKVFAAASIPHIFETACVVIAGGGGGIPVRRHPDGTFTLVDAVIDKDSTACLLARDVGATHFFLLTGVPHVSIDFGTPDERALGHVGVAEMEEHLQRGQFPPGSMGPKVRACLEFARHCDGVAVITNADNVGDAIEGRAGTHVSGNGRPSEVGERRIGARDRRSGPGNRRTDRIG